jgi:hypothetical protein
MRKTMKGLLSAIGKIILLTVVSFIINAVMGIILPLSNDMIAAMTPEDQALFMPLYLLNIFINMAVMYIVLNNLKYSGWKLFLAVWMAFFGLFTVLNSIELYWFNESFPLFNYTDVSKLIFNGMVAYGITALTGTWLVSGFKRNAQKSETTLWELKTKASFLASIVSLVYRDRSCMYYAFSSNARYGSLRSFH